MYNLADPLPFYKIVWEIVRQIPAGVAATYGQIASMIPAPEGVDQADYNRLGARWVGDAMNAVSRVDEPNIPWHRVINAKGGISLPETSQAAALQRGRLRAEGILDNASERVDLGEYGWEGPSADWLRAHQLNAPRSLRRTPTPAARSAPRRTPPPADSGDDTPQQLKLF